MLQINELDDPRPVPAHLQGLGPQRIGHQRRQTFVQDAVTVHRRQVADRQLTGELVLATRHRQNDARLPANRAGQGVVGRRIAGVQRHGQIHRSVVVKFGDLRPVKRDLVQSHTLGHLTTIGHHLGFALDPDDPHLTAPQFPQQVMHRKRQIALPTTEVHHPQFSLLRQAFNAVVDQFQEPVDLAKLSLSRGFHSALGSHHADRFEEVARLSVGQQVLLGTIVRRRFGRTGRGRPTVDLQSPPTTNPGRDILIGTKQVQVAITFGKPLADPDHRGCGFEIFVRLAPVGLGSELVAGTIGQSHRPHHDPVGQVRLVTPPSAQHHTVAGRIEHRSTHHLHDLAHTLRHC